MQDKKLREAFRALVKHLNIRVEDCYGYRARNSPPNADCNVARLSDIRYLQQQIDELQKKPKKVNKRK